MPTPLSLPLVRLFTRLLLALGSALVCLAVCEGLASLWTVVAAAPPDELRTEENHSAHDADLGWSHVPHSHLPDLYGPGRSLTINGQGLRATEAYARPVPPGRLRVLCVGDSFTMGFGVDDTQTFPAQLEALCPQVQAVNMGMGGYGLDQAYLWYERDGDRLEADVAVLCVIDADLFRMGHADFLGAAKPLLSVVDGELQVGNVPVPPPAPAASRLLRWWRHTALGNLRTRSAGSGAGGDPESDVFRPPEHAPGAGEPLMELGKHVLDAFVRLARQRGHRPMLLYIPTEKPLLMGQRTGPGTFLSNWARAHSVPFVDAQQELSGLGTTRTRQLFLEDNHFDVAGNGVIAATLLERLARDGLVACAPPPRPWIVGGRDG